MQQKSYQYSFLLRCIGQLINAQTLFCGLIDFLDFPLYSKIIFKLFDPLEKCANSIKMTFYSEIVIESRILIYQPKKTVLTSKNSLIERERHACFLQISTKNARWMDASRRRVSYFLEQDTHSSGAHIHHFGSIASQIHIQLDCSCRKSS